MCKAVIVVGPWLAALRVLLPQGDSMSGIHEFEDSVRPNRLHRVDRVFPE